MSESYKVALVGAGGIAAAHRAAAEASEGRVEVVAVVDPRDGTPAGAGLPRYEVLDQLLASGHRPDGIVLCTPPNVREELVRPALAAGLAVLIEKPLARTHVEAESLVRLVDEHNARDRCFVGYCHRFAPAVIEMRRRLLAGDLGTPLRFENTFACWFPAMEKAWMSDPAVSGGGSFLDTGCHSLDLFRYLIADPIGGTDVAGHVLHHAWPGRGDSDASVLLKTKQGVAGVIHSGWQEPEQFTVKIVGTTGSISYDYAEPELLRHKRSTGGANDLPIETHDVRFLRQLLAFADPASEERDRLCRVEEAAEVARLTDAVR
jgi:predicted dehydrogenase